MWLACKALKGMFPGEVAISFSTAEGQSLSLFVQEGAVRMRTGSIKDLNGVALEAFIEVALLEKDENFGLVALPATPIEGPAVAKVSRNLLTAQIG
jgi:hypothetical protein